MKESAFQAEVIKFAKLHGWVCFHPYDSRRSVPGFPDLLLLRPRDGRRLVAELKIPPNKVTPAQAEWLQSFEVCGVPAYRWTPAEWQEIEQVLR